MQTWAVQEHPSTTCIGNLACKTVRSPSVSCCHWSASGGERNTARCTASDPHGLAWDRMRRSEGRSTCRVGQSILPGLRADVWWQRFGWDVLTLRGAQLETRTSSPLSKPVRNAPVASWDLPTVPSSRKKAVERLLMDSACVLALPRPRAKSSGLHGSPCCTALVIGIFSGLKQDKTVNQIAQVAISGQA